LLNDFKLEKNMKSLLFGVYGKGEINLTCNIENFSINDKRKINFLQVKYLKLYYYNGVTGIKILEDERYFLFFSGDISFTSELSLQGREIENLFKDILLLSSGNFSFIIYDKLTDKIVISNDLFGLYPLFYCRYNNSILFSNEYQPLLFANTKKDFNIKAINHYFKYGFTLMGETLFKSVYLLQRPILFDIKGKIRFMNKPNFKTLNFPEYDNWLDELNNSLNQAVDRFFQIHKTPLVTLTGGLDSRLVLAMTNAEDRQKSQYITLFLPPLNEKNDKDVLIAKIIAKELNLNLTIVEFKEKTEPLNINFFNAMRLSIETPIFTGQYGGELFNATLFKQNVLPNLILNQIEDRNLIVILKNPLLFYLYRKLGRRLLYFDIFIKSFFTSIYGGTDGVWLHPWADVLRYFSPFIDTQVLKVWYSIPKQFLLQKNNTLILDLYDSSYKEFTQFKTNTKLPNMERFGFEYFEAGLEPKKYKVNIKKDLFDVVKKFESYNFIPSKFKNLNYEEKIIDFCYWCEYVEKNIITS